MELKICHLYPDVMNLYGDSGNILCLQQRLRWRGIDSTVSRVMIGDSLSLSDFDLLFIGGGQDFEQEVLPTQDFYVNSQGQIVFFFQPALMTEPSPG